MSAEPTRRDQDLVTRRTALGTALAAAGGAALAPADVERYNPNYVGGDITGGAQDFWQVFARPVLSLNPYATSDPNLFICSASTPPGGGVHGMCGFFAAQMARERLS